VWYYGVTYGVDIMTSIEEFLLKRLASVSSTFDELKCNLGFAVGDGIDGIKLTDKDGSNSPEAIIGFLGDFSDEAISLVESNPGEYPSIDSFDDSDKHQLASHLVSDALISFYYDSPGFNYNSELMSFARASDINTSNSLIVIKKITSGVFVHDYYVDSEGCFELISSTFDTDGGEITYEYPDNIPLDGSDFIENDRLPFLVSNESDSRYPSLTARVLGHVIQDYDFINDRFIGQEAFIEDIDEVYSGGERVNLGDPRISHLKELVKKDGVTMIQPDEITVELSSDPGLS